ncbi:hypothetical protein ElyMa_004056200 [Elysia marginata]|uniref:Uncharacterized protein n=1 Tax=Elysia marginata TaxID=1093978 RepID=A0AAV4G850_9GAST|nr:hypothetical protein ElyMa_004056200 [Elysia marginata]
MVLKIRCNNLAIRALLTEHVSGTEGSGSPPDQDPFLRSQAAFPCERCGSATLCITLVAIFAFIGQSSAQTQPEKTWIQTVLSPACDHLTYLMDEVYCTGSPNVKCDAVI